MADAGLAAIFAGVVLLVASALVEFVLRRYSPVLPKLAQRAPLIRRMTVAVVILGVIDIAVALVLLRD